MPEPVIVATARSPIGRAFKGSLVTLRPDDMAAQILTAVLAKVPELDPTQVEDLILKQPELAPHYLLEITRPGNLDELTVHVEMGAELAHGSQDARHAAAQKLEHNVKAYIGVSAVVRLALPNGIERSVGKAKRVVDRRPR